MAKLYSECFTEGNIKKAIKEIYKHEGSRTPGPDGITKDSNISDKRIIKEVRMRLRRCRKVNSRTVDIPKKNGKIRTLTIINLFDRIAQQAVYQMIEPILDRNMSKDSYGFRKGISTKVPVSKICAKVSNSKEVYTIEVDFTKCFDNIPLDKALDMLRQLGVNDAKLISTIKHLMYTSEGYKGIGLSQGTILGPILANCYLHKLDTWVSEHIDTPDSNFTRALKKHPNDLREWRESRGKGPTGKYYRYADDSIILTGSRIEQLWIKEILTTFINEELDIKVNKEKTQLNYNAFNFLGYRIIKQKNLNKSYICIVPADPEAINEKIKGMKWRSPENIRKSLRVLIGLLNYYDICNNLANMLDKIGLKLVKVAHRKGTALKKVEGHTKFIYSLNKQEYELDIYGLRKATRTSYKEYLVDSSWLTKREELKELGAHFQTHNIYKWALWTLQRGKDKVTGKELFIDYLHVHHVNGKHTDNRLENMILVSQSTHRLIHSSEPTKDKKVLRYRKALSRKD